MNESDNRLTVLVTVFFGLLMIGLVTASAYFLLVPESSDRGKKIDHDEDVNCIVMEEQESYYVQKCIFMYETGRV